MYSILYEKNLEYVYTQLGEIRINVILKKGYSTYIPIANSFNSHKLFALCCKKFSFYATFPLASPHPWELRHTPTSYATSP